MSEQKAVPEIPEDLREMYESSKLDTTMFVGSQIRQLIRRITNLEAELAELRATDHTVQMEETADAKAERKKYEALREERDALKATVQRLSAPSKSEEMIPVWESATARAIISERDREWKAAIQDEGDRISWQGFGAEATFAEAVHARLLAARTTPPATPEHMCCGTFGPVEEPRHGVTNLRGPLVLRHGPDCKECQEVAERVRQIQATPPAKEQP